MSAQINSCFYRGEVMHHRMRPHKHRFIYKVASWLIDLDEVDTLNSLKLFSHNRFNLFSFHDRDHGDGSDTPLKEQIRSILQSHDINTGKGSIMLLCYPRIFGYVFNPLSVFYCYDEQKTLQAILYEVSNTFGQRHSYLIPTDENATSRIVRQNCRKLLYVSPFMPMETDYSFRMQPPGNRIAVCIRQSGDEGPVLDATFTGIRHEISNSALVRSFLRYPLMTLKVIAGIHWEALRLWRKGMRLQPRPDAPTYSVSLVSGKGVTVHEAI
ncbi:DUF1365 domain-containing protein [Nitrincola sp. MINF-07-Sa-05]|uniref:DUF1365 domain-containing protein n=1 Tax=Nitrincola salilacus TaxID=3400273 RepID=UPI003918021C